MSLLASGFLDELTRDIFTMVGLPLALLGIAFAIQQIGMAAEAVRKIATNTEAAAAATTQTRNAVASNLEVAALAAGVRLIAEVEALVRSEQFDAAAVRVTDLRDSIVQLRRTRPYEERIQERFQESLATASSVKDSLLRRHYRPTTRFDVLAIHKRLEEISDFLNEMAATSRLRLGVQDANS